MFTMNWYKAIAQNMYADYSEIKFKSLTGSEMKSSSQAYWQKLLNVYGDPDKKNGEKAAPYMDYVVTDFSVGGVIFGTGTTPPTLDDYCMSGETITAITWASNGLQSEITDNGLTIANGYTITNTGEEAITIGEIGLIASPTGSTAEGNYALLERTVLDAPITIEPGGVGQVTYTVRFNYPTA